MNNEIKEILDYYRYIVNDKKETYTVVSKDTIYLEQLLDYITNLQQENELLKEQLKVLKDDIRVAYCDLMSTDVINKKELEDIEVL